MLDLKFIECQKENIKEVVDIINLAYRGEKTSKSWTTEAHLLGGKRIEDDMLEEILEEKDSKIYLAKFEDKIVGNIQAKLENGSIFIGLFAVHPDFQSSGVGKRLLEFAEKSSMKLYSADKFIMQVITIRNDLIDFYKRRGYKVTDSFLEFPKSEIWNVKTKEELKFVILEKDILR